MDTERKTTLQDIIKIRQLTDDINASYSFIETWSQVDSGDFYIEVFIDQFCIYWWRANSNKLSPSKVKLTTANDIGDLLWRLERLAESLNDQVLKIIFGKD